ncbi:uncharacterized protein LOC129727726 isoform X2 [Wyeomyia smithii]|uniref:uncharacterized protein LOC129727726 isoform X2 n=1 Tax=Wyeomyia smithii TaxID=174621 RepID=UPI002467C433|nr:uncharacterized protein LOC129727726 isoform X2 [Wyeomyia smithii]
MNLAKYLVTLGYFFYYVQAVDSSELLMLPNDRITLDDCYLRYHTFPDRQCIKPVSGSPALLKEFAHIGAIGWTQSDGTVSWNCGGTLIWANVVLTAAHCTLDSSNTQPDVIRFGDLNIYSSDDDDYAQQLKIVEIIKHPEHRYSAQYHDIALMKLEKNVVLHETVVPACLWTDEEVRFKSLEAAGWGAIGFAAEQTPVLLKVTLKPIDNQECGETYTNKSSHKLRFGLQSHQMCAVDERMDTCQGDSGGPLQVKLMHNGKVTPFIVGVTSFGLACGNSAPGVYTKVSFYNDWIIDTMRSFGENVNESTYNATFCALRYVNFREYEDAAITWKNESFVSLNFDQLHVHETENLPPYVAKLSWRSGGRDDCHGVIIDETTVLTLAECVFYNGTSVDHILYLKDQKMDVSKIHIHPEYIEGSGYNNIAILSLEHLVDVYQIRPACVWHDQKIPYNEVNFFGTGRVDINTFDSNVPLINSSTTLLRPRAAVQNSTTCIISKQYGSRLKNGLKEEHICMGNDFFLVPKSCDVSIGGPIHSYTGCAEYFPEVYGLMQFGRDCGFGEHTVATGFANHLDWMKSVILKSHSEEKSALQFLDYDLHEGDACSNNNKGQAGLCVNVSKCSQKWKQLLTAGSIYFCSSTSVICCPLDAVDRAADIHPDLAACPDVVRNIKSKSNVGSLVHIGWFENYDTISFNCIGSIITKNIILTTASCLGEVVPAVIKLISNDSDSFYHINATLKHHAFNATDNSNDIGLLRLTEKFEWSSDVYPSCLWTNKTHTPLVLEMIIATGPVDVFYRRVIAMYNSDCQRTNAYQLPGSQLCVRDPMQKPTCSEEPSILQWERDDEVVFVVGSSTILPDCEDRFYMIFTRFSAYSQWISDMLLRV